MDLGPLRALALEINVEVLGVDIIVTPLNSDLIETRGIWMTPQPDLSPGGSNFRAVSPRRVMAISRVAVATLPINSTIQAAERNGDLVQTWRVEGVERSESDHHRVILVSTGQAA